MGELQLVESFPMWKAFLWIFYPITILVIFEVVSSAFNDNDDDDFGGGKMIPAYQGVRN